MSSKKSKMLPGFKYSCFALLAAGAVLYGTTVKAGVFEDNVDKVNTLSDTIAGIVNAMTDVAIVPMGLGAAMKTFRHIVLMNV